jgi:hypothetical protein
VDDLRPYRLAAKQCRRLADAKSLDERAALLEIADDLELLIAEIQAREQELRESIRRRR